MVDWLKNLALLFFRWTMAADGISENVHLIAGIAIVRLRVSFHCHWSLLDRVLNWRILVT